jgi:FkbM family methyltransferase
MEKYLNFNDGFYIEAGANDGTAQSNTISLEQKGWSGLLIEPNQYQLSVCKNNRSDKNIFEHCALVSFEHKGLTIRGNFAEQNVDDSLVGQVTVPLDYWDHDQLTAAKEKLSRENIDVPAKTLQSLIDQHGLTHIDFLSLDTEGYEYEAMNGLDFSRNPPRYIRVETSSYQHRIDDMVRYLGTKGYIFRGMSSINDCFFEANLKA